MKISDLSKISTRAELHAIPRGIWRKVYVVHSYITRNRLRTLIMLSILLLSGLSEGIGVMSLIIVLKIVMSDAGNIDSQTGVESKFSEFVNRYEMFNDLGLMLLIVVGAICSKAIFEMVGKSYISKIQMNLVADAKLELVRQISNARWSYFISYKLGRFVTALNEESRSGPAIYNSSLQFVAGLFTLIVYLTISLILSWELTVAIILCSIAILVLLSGFIRLAERLSYKGAELNRSIAGRLADGLSGIKSLKSMGLTEYLIPLIRKEIRSLMRTQFLSAVASNGLKYSRDPIVAIVVGIGLYYAVKSNFTDSSVIIGMVVLFHRANSGVNQLQGLYQIIAKVEGNFFSFQELLLSAKENAEETKLSVNPINLKGNIELEQVYFRYAGSENTVLDDVSLLCSHGSITALIGPSGAGKTTILDMLCCLYRPTSGRILIDGHDLAEFDLKLWRNSVGYVEQDSLLFHDTVAVNVSLSDPSLGQDDIELALERAGAMSFVSELPMKLDTVLGEKGVLLSGGQRQRITIARALVRKPKVLLLDEATTALDPQTEKAVVETLQKLKDDITIIAVSHQARIAEVADCVYHLESGRIERVQ